MRDGPRASMSERRPRHLCDLRFVLCMVSSECVCPIGEGMEQAWRHDIADAQHDESHEETHGQQGGRGCNRVHVSHTVKEQSEP